MRFFPRLLSCFCSALLIFVVAVSNASGACTKNSCSDRIKQLIVDSGGAYIQLSADLAPLNCAPDSKIFIRLPKVHSNYDSIYAGLLIGKTIGNSVTLRIDEKSNPCTLNYLVLGE